MLSLELLGRIVYKVLLLFVAIFYKSILYVGLLQDIRHRKGFKHEALADLGLHA